MKGLPLLSIRMGLESILQNHWQVLFVILTDSTHCPIGSIQESNHLSIGHVSAHNLGNKFPNEHHTIQSLTHVDQSLGLITEIRSLISLQECTSSSHSSDDNLGKLCPI